MSLSRREFLQLLTAASAAGFALPGCDSSNTTTAHTTASSTNPADPYELKPFGNVSFMHFTDCHAQLLPVHFREPNINLGFGSAYGKAPHLVGDKFLKHFGIKPGTREAHAFTYLNYVEAAQKYGKVGGFAHLATLVKQIKAQRPNALLLDGGDTWQGSATALWTKGQDMIDACKLLGVDVMTGHWEFTYGAKRVQDIIKNDLDGHIEFLAQNVVETTFEDRIFNPYTIKEQNGIKIAVIGQAFPYTPIANPRYMIPDWSFGIRDEALQELVDEVRGKGAQVVVILSHNGMDVDLKMASRVTGVDAIMGGHTHDGVPAPSVISNSNGKTLVINSGSNGKFLSVLDLEVKGGKVNDYRFKMLPIFSNLIKADAQMTAHINKVRAPYKAKLEEKLAITDSLLYRRGNFNGTFDQLILNAQIEVQGADMAFSPGFRWGVSLLPGEAITREALMSQTAITYPKATLNTITGENLKTIMEGIADNLFHEDPYYQMGGDMVRTAGLKYTIDPTAKMDHRISDMEINGSKVEASKEYLVAGWAAVNPVPKGRPIWDIVEEYLKSIKVVKIDKPNVPKLKGSSGNPGIASI